MITFVAENDYFKTETKMITFPIAKINLGLNVV